MWVVVQKSVGNFLVSKMVYLILYAVLLICAADLCEKRPHHSDILMNIPDSTYAYTYIVENPQVKQKHVVVRRANNRIRLVPV